MSSGSPQRPAGMIRARFGQRHGSADAAAATRHQGNLSVSLRLLTMLTVLSLAARHVATNGDTARLETRATY